MARFWNRLIEMDNKRLTKQIFLWEKDKNKSNSWSHDFKKILENTDNLSTYENILYSETLYTKTCPQSGKIM